MESEASGWIGVAAWSPITSAASSAASSDSEETVCAPVDLDELSENLAKRLRRSATPTDAGAGWLGQSLEGMIGNYPNQPQSEWFRYVPEPSQNCSADYCRLVCFLESHTGFASSGR